MLIKQIAIKSFGKLQNYTLDLSKQNPLTLLIMPNESGKSTLLAFIRACFYGLGDKRGGKQALARREQYQHFKGTQSAGSISFTYREHNYELQRVFGKSRRLDAVGLIDLDLGKTLDIGDKEPGTYLFNIGEEQFLSTVLVEQMQLALPYKAGANQELVDALSNLGLTGQKQFNLQKALDNLDEQARVLQHKRGKGGTIYAAEQELANLQQEQAELRQKKEKLVALQSGTNALAKEIVAAETLLASTRSKLLLVDIDESLANLLAQFNALQANLSAVASELDDLEPERQSLADREAAVGTQLLAFVEELLRKLTSDYAADLVEQPAISEIKAQLTAYAAELSALLATPLTSGNYTQLHYALKDAGKLIDNAVAQVLSSWQQLLSSEKATLSAEISTLQAQKQQLLEQAMQEQTQDEAELKAAVEASFKADGQATRLHLELEQAAQDLAHKEQELKRALQRKTAYHTRTTKLQENLNYLQADIAAETARLAEGEQAIKQLAQLLDSNANERRSVEAEQQRLQGEQKTLIGKQVQLGSLVPLLVISTLLLLAAGSLTVYTFLTAWQLYWQLAAACATLITVGALSYLAVKYCSLQSEIKSLQSEVKELAVIEQSLQKLQQEQVDLSTEKLVLIRDNNHTYLEKLAAEDRRIRAEIEDFSKQQETLAEEIAALEKAQQSQRLLQLSRQNDYKQLSEKATFLATTVSKSEEFILNRKNKRQAKQETLDRELSAAKQRLVALDGGQTAARVQAAELSYQQFAAAFKEWQAKLAFAKWQAGWQALQAGEQECLLALANSEQELLNRQGQLEGLMQEYLALFALDKQEVFLETEYFAAVTACFKAQLQALKQVQIDYQAAKAEIKPAEMSQQARSLQVFGSNLQAITQLLYAKLLTALLKVTQAEPNGQPLELAALALPPDAPLNDAKFFNDEEFSALQSEYLAYLNNLKAALKALQSREQQDFEAKKLLYSADMRECKLLYSSLPNSVLLAEKLAEVERNLAKQRQTYAAILAAKDLLTALFLELQRDFSPKVREAAAKYLTQITGGKYREILLDSDLHLYLRYQEDEQYHEAEYLSGGTYEQLYLALRLALSELLGAEGKLPLLLDDSFVQFDNERTQSAWDTVLAFAREQGRQVVFLTCHSHYASYVKE